eukprot:Hpha_TRINITY_DN16287_c2_g4::TRINITY_DN16287_c2_g4_i1::g.11684::m.11684/K19476/IST1; vacuolar protein sorting-associated protein IST1
MGLFSREEKFDKLKVKAALKMAVTRIKLQQNKRLNGVKVQRREIAQLMAAEKYESSRIKVEQTVRDEYYCEALELLTLFCDLVASRITLVAESSQCPLDLKEAISTIIWAAPRTDGIVEFDNIRKQIFIKFGKEWCMVAQENREMAVNQRVYQKLSCFVPEPYICMQYLKGIADEYEDKLDISWVDIEEKLASTTLVPSATGISGQAVSTEGLEWTGTAPPAAGQEVPTAAPVAAYDYPQTKPQEYQQPPQPHGGGDWPAQYPPPGAAAAHPGPPAQPGPTSPSRGGYSAPAEKQSAPLPPAPAKQSAPLPPEQPPPAGGAGGGLWDLPQAPGHQPPAGGAPAGGGATGFDDLDAKYEALKRAQGPP